MDTRAPVTFSGARFAGSLRGTRRYADRVAQCELGRGTAVSRGGPKSAQPEFRRRRPSCPSSGGADRTLDRPSRDGSKNPPGNRPKVNASYFARAQTRSEPTKSADATSGTEVVQPKCCSLRNFTFPVCVVPRQFGSELSSIRKVSVWPAGIAARPLVAGIALFPE